MKTKRPTTRAERRAKKPADLPTRFEPKFWSDADRRQCVVKEVIRRYELLKADSGCDSFQKDLLCQRASFMAIRLESMEIAATEGGTFEAGIYTQLTNALIGLLRTLGLNQVKSGTTIDLQSYTDPDIGKTAKQRRQRRKDRMRTERNRTEKASSNRNGSQ